MCGICGIINLKNEVIKDAPVRQMMQIIKHRGPDDEGVFIEDNVGLGFVRLSILDLSSAGHQPMHSDDDRYVVVFNGEIYNYIELREELKVFGYTFHTNSDTEVLLAAYREWGEECLNRFNGMWAFAIYDRVKKVVFAARDRFGVKPFYYIHTPELFAFASEIPPLLSLLPGKPLPDYQSIFDYLAFSRTDQTENTFFKEIKKLQHGCKLSITDSVLTITNWYSLKDSVKRARRFADSNEFRQCLSASIGLRLRSDVPVGVCLSGGLDSSSIVSLLLSDYDKTDLNTFSAVYRKGQKGDETEYIKEYSPQLMNMFYVTPTAESFKVDINSFIKAHAEPIPSTSPYAQFKVMELAKGKVVVTLDGQGADEQLAGYQYFFGFYFKDLLLTLRIGRLFKELFYYVLKHRSLFGVKSFLFFLLPQGLRTRVRVNEKAYLNKLFVSKYSKNNSITGNLYGSKSLNEALLNHFEFKLEHLLKWSDRNSMWFSLESRVPFLDYNLVERVLASSGDQVIRNGMTKHLLREGLKEVLPERIRMRRDKIGFGTPEDEWFRTHEWQNMIVEIIKSESFKARGVIDPSKALLQYYKHLNGDINLSREIWKWIHLELWFREYID